MSGFSQEEKKNPGLCSAFSRKVALAEALRALFRIHRGRLCLLPSGVHKPISSSSPILQAHIVYVHVCDDVNEKKTVVSFACLKTLVGWLVKC